MRLAELLRSKETAIVGRWLEEALATYPERAAAVFGRQTDPFGNPVGHSLRVGTRAIFDAVVDGADDVDVREALAHIIRIRAVQELSAARAAGFVFGLRRAIRAELADAFSDPRRATEWAELDDHIDRLALAAFDIYVDCRERVYQLRVNEVKRQVSWVVDRMNRRDAGAPESSIEAEAGVGR
jgi:hypothetical protein